MRPRSTSRRVDPYLIWGILFLVIGGTLVAYNHLVSAVIWLALGGAILAQYTTAGRFPRARRTVVGIASAGVATALLTLTLWTEVLG